MRGRTVARLVYLRAIGFTLLLLLFFHNHVPSRGLTWSVRVVVTCSGIARLPTSASQLRVFLYTVLSSFRWSSHGLAILEVISDGIFLSSLDVAIPAKPDISQMSFYLINSSCLSHFLFVSCSIS